MPSRIERRWLERLALGTALLAITLLAFSGPEGQTTTVRDEALTDALSAATRHAVPGLDLELDAIPGPAERAWAVAVRGAGTQVRWSTRRAVSPWAIVLDPLGTPGGGFTWRALAPPGATVRDAAGEVWRAAEAGAAEATVLSASGVALVTPHGTARPQSFAPTPMKRVRVAGRAGWEARFVAEALRAAGWDVEAEFTVTLSPAPVGVRTPGARAGLDTATHAAVVLVGRDAVAPPRLSEFVRGGGGLILVGDAVQHLATTAIAPASVLGVAQPVPGTLATALPRRALGGWRLRPRSDAVVIERRGDDAMVVARREALGRVVAVGYDETWRWQLEGPEGSAARYAAWWSALVGSVSRVAGAPLAPGGDPVPLAAWTAALGAAAPGPGTPVLARLDERWLLAMALLSLAVAWLSRRLRGLP
ncbi:MAG: hypothetical protein IPK85_26825 [Gemmatimonadetes bacterium]|nr:hypothetical protein [Gemmatimonadota bacterium]